MRDCPNCSNKFSNWRLFSVQIWSPSFYCPHCNIELTHEALFYNRAAAGALVGIGLASGLLSSIALFLAFLSGLIIYEYFLLTNSKLLEFDKKQKQKYEKRIYVSPKLGPVTAFIAILSGIILLIISLFTFLINNSGEGIYILRLVTFFGGVIGIIAGVRINNSLRKKPPDSVGF